MKWTSESCGALTAKSGPWAFEIEPEISGSPTEPNVPMNLYHFPSNEQYAKGRYWTVTEAKYVAQQWLRKQGDAQ
jgi:hypothetical protein